MKFIIWLLKENLLPTGFLGYRKPSLQMYQGMGTIGKVIYRYTCRVCKEDFWSTGEREVCKKWSCYRDYAS